MQNAAFAARALDWAYLPLLVEEGQVEIGDIDDLECGAAPP